MHQHREMFELKLLPVSLCSLFSIILKEKRDNSYCKYTQENCRGKIEKTLLNNWNRIYNGQNKFDLLIWFWLHQYDGLNAWRHFDILLTKEYG